MMQTATSVPTTTQRRGLTPPPKVSCSQAATSMSSKPTNVRAFTVGDLAAASLLDVRFGPHVVLELLEREECNTLLTDIPSDLLARKRPQLMPILDSVIIDALHLEGLDGWLALRAALTPALRHRIDELAQAATDQGAARPSTLRLLDVATWMMHSQSRQAKAVRTAWAR